jgi:hypothetical protein
MSVAINFVNFIHAEAQRRRGAQKEKRLLIGNSNSEVGRQGRQGERNK